MRLHRGLVRKRQGATRDPRRASALEEMAANIRTEVNEAIFAGIVARMGPEGRQRAQGRLDTAGSDGRSMFNR